MTETIHPKTAAIPARYVAVWNEPDAAARRAAVAELWTPDATEFVDGGTQYHGHEELADRVTEAYEAFVGSGRFTVTGADDVTAHGDIVAFTLRMTTSDGEVRWAARVFLLLGADGLIEEDYQLTVQPLAA